MNGVKRDKNWQKGENENKTWQRWQISWKMMMTRKKGIVTCFFILKNLCPSLKYHDMYICIVFDGIHYGNQRSSHFKLQNNMTNEKIVWQNLRKREDLIRLYFW